MSHDRETHSDAWTSLRPSSESKRQLPLLLDSLELREEVQTCGTFGIGLKVDPTTNEVLKVKDVIRRPGKQTAKLLSEGDTLLKINGAELGQTGNTVERLIPGDFNTYVTLQFRDKVTGKEYELDAMRHVPLQVWERKIRRYEIREHLAGQDLCADPRLVKVLEGIRDSVVDRSGDFVDLLHYWEADPHMSLGLLFAGESSPCRIGTVSRLTSGCPAQLMDLVRPGDEVQSVNGVEVRSSNLLQLLSSAEVAARRKATLRILREGAMITVDVPCVSQSSFRTVEQVVSRLGALEQLVIARANQDQALDALERVVESIHWAACERILAEVRQAELLCQAQQRIADQVLEAEVLLRPIRSFTKGLEDLVPRADLEAVRAECERHKAAADRLRPELDRQHWRLQDVAPGADLDAARADCELHKAAAAHLRVQIEQIQEQLVPRVDLDAARADCESHKAAAIRLEARVSQLQEQLGQVQERLATHEVEPRRERVAPQRGDQLQERSVPLAELALSRDEAEGLSISTSPCSVLPDAIPRTIHDAEVIHARALTHAY